MWEAGRAGGHADDVRNGCRWADKCMDRWRERWTDQRAGIWIHGKASRWIDGCTDRHKVRQREGGVN